MVLTILLASALTVSYAAKPKLKVATDGFPTGQNTPEGAATDLARAFIQRDTALFRRVCIRPYGGGKARSEYVELLEGTSDSLRQQREKGKPSLNDPSKITRVFVARHLSKSGPASYGYASFDFRDVMFVDVEVSLRDSSRYVKRTMVIKDRDGKWYVHPAPDVSPLLSECLDQESASVQVFSDIYDVEE